MIFKQAILNGLSNVQSSLTKIPVMIKSIVSGARFRSYNLLRGFQMETDMILLKCVLQTALWLKVKEVMKMGVRQLGKGAAL